MPKSLVFEWKLGEIPLVLWETLTGLFDELLCLEPISEVGFWLDFGLSMIFRPPLFPLIPFMVLAIE